MILQLYNLSQSKNFLNENMVKKKKYKQLYRYIYFNVCLPFQKLCRNLLKIHSIHNLSYLSLQDHTKYVYCIHYSNANLQQNYKYLFQVLVFVSQTCIRLLSIFGQEILSYYLLNLLILDFLHCLIVVVMDNITC